MANEIAARAILRMLVEGEEPVEIDTLTQYFDMTGTEYVDGIFSIGTSAEDIPLGDVGTPGWVFIKHLGTAGYLETGYDTTALDADESVNKIDVGGFLQTQWGAATVTIRANTGNIRTRVFIAEV